MVTFGVISLSQRLDSEVKCSFFLPHTQKKKKKRILKSFSGLNMYFVIQVILHFPWCIYLLCLTLPCWKQRQWKEVLFLYLTTCIIHCFHYRVTCSHTTLILEMSQSVYAGSAWANHSAITPESRQSCEWTHFQMLSIFYEFPSTYFNGEL